MTTQFLSISEESITNDKKDDLIVINLLPNKITTISLPPEKSKWLSRCINGRICTIVVPETKWRPKLVSKYTIPEYYDKYIDSILDYVQYGKFVYKTDLPWLDNKKRMNSIIFHKDIHSTELDKDLSVDISVNLMIQTSITNIITNFWGCFIKEGEKNNPWVSVWHRYRLHKNSLLQKNITQFVRIQRYHGTGYTTL